MQVEIGQLPPTETVRLTFRIPVSDKAIDAIGVVVWSKETRQGIQFTNVSTQDREAIGQFVDSVEKLDAPL
jgi:hypothetical protein